MFHTKCTFVELCSVISICHLKRNFPSCLDGDCIFGGYILPTFQIFPCSDSDSALYWSWDFHCHFPVGIIVLIFYFCGHKCSGTENTVGREGWKERGREGGREGGRERGRERGMVIMGMVESFREKEGKEQKNGKKNAILSKNMPII